ncbi:PspA/IM30 family protein [Microcoleus sp. FACHB-1515]|uniref:PspA/IM30 family protein n=1 Tax=Cyanophyceae TaxID=3028117 RepID=UPI0016821B59|nr:PspA/IM30 family protein [Microcoleus sp. FACHB-1515]MBD2091173.1 PspA/IM30 family protein [Microcoleus sp. FACHB-1515]
MGLFESTNRTVRANLARREAEMLDSLCLQDESIKELTKSILILAQSIAVAESTFRNLEIQHKQTLSEVLNWGRTVNLAKQRGREDLAKEALIREQTSKQKAIGQKTRINAQVSNLNVLKNNLSDLTIKLIQLQEKKLAAVLKFTAPAPAAPSLNKSEIDKATAYFNQLEAASMKAEPKLEALDLEEMFALLENGTDPDLELEMLKAQLLKGCTVSNPANRTTADSTDDELECLTRQLDHL